LHLEQVWLHETPGGTAVIVSLSVGDGKAVLARLAQTLTPFDRWLRQQVLTLHGLDLPNIAQATGYSLTAVGSSDDIIGD
jgi:hypothetical protein